GTAAHHAGPGRLTRENRHQSSLESVRKARPGRPWHTESSGKTRCATAVPAVLDPFPDRLLARGCRMADRPSSLPPVPEASRDRLPPPRRDWGQLLWPASAFAG